jgi:hypothetical protein
VLVGLLVQYAITFGVAMSVRKVLYNQMQTTGRYRVEVTHRWSVPRWYTWEILDASRVLPVLISQMHFSSWEEASIAGKIALADVEAGAQM